MSAPNSENPCTSTAELAPPQTAIAGAGGLQLSVWMFRLSAVLLLAGVVLTLAGAPGGSPLTRLGLLALMATPALRVFDLLAGYVRSRDWGTVAAMLAVLMVVLMTLLVARG